MVWHDIVFRLHYTIRTAIPRKMLQHADDPYRHFCLNVESGNKDIDWPGECGKYHFEHSCCGCGMTNHMEVPKWSSLMQFSQQTGFNGIKPEALSRSVGALDKRPVPFSFPADKSHAMGSILKILLDSCFIQSWQNPVLNVRLFCLHAKLCR